jgi:exosome complex exonuclease RRP6
MSAGDFAHISELSSSIDELVLSQESSDVFLKKLMGSLVASTKISNGIPDQAQFGHHAIIPLFREISNKCSEEICHLLLSLCNFVRPGSDSDDVMNDVVTAGNLGNVLDPSLYEHVADMVSFLLEGADTQMLRGSSDPDAQTAASKNLKLTLAVDKERLLRGNTLDMTKPQLAFLSTIDNSRYRPFRPRLRSKPHAHTPLNLVELSIDTKESEVVGPSSYYAHPYEQELRKLVYPEFQLADGATIQPWLPPSSQPFAFVDTEDALLLMVDELDNAREIAIDLEHHSYRSFQGITCLMQISSRDKDYVVDALVLRAHLSALLRVTANPNIVKILHGCESDILWLQRDFGLYIVNCFDTYHAAKILRYPARSLSHLVKYHCGVTLDKKFQLADWRQRPLSDEMIG